MTAALPIDAVLPELQAALRHHSRCLLVAQPGAGKTTRAPLALLEATPADTGRWLLLEPRRVAARLAAGYMAEQLGEKAGGTVGYRVRGESRVGERTRLEVVTQGILTRMLQDDPLLEGVAGIIFDEFHERSLEADLGLALALDVQSSVRNDLKLLVMSATLDVDALLAVLGETTPVIDCPGRVWPVATLYRPESSREDSDNHRAAVVAEALAKRAGDILVFLPGVGEIRRLEKLLSAQRCAGIDIRPLHGQLSLEQQQAVLRPHEDGKRRVILATAIAESSLTVPGVRIVIDAGLERLPVFQPRSGLTRLTTRPVNRASADQRRGRAGREAPGSCYRLWSQERILVAHREPEILQADLSTLVFELVRWGIDDPRQLNWVTLPPEPALSAALTSLRNLDLVDTGGKLTDTGRRAARWPTQPRLALLLDAASTGGQLPLACWLVAWLEEGIGGDDPDIHNLFSRLPDSRSQGAEGRWYRTAAQWARRAGCSLTVKSLDALAPLLANTFPERLAMNQGGGRFRLATGGQLILPDKHPLGHRDFLVAVALDGNPGGARLFHGIAIDRRDIEASFADAREWRAEVRWDDNAGRLIGEEVRALGAVILESRPLKKLPREAVVGALLDGVRRRGAIPWSDDDRQILGRLRLLHRVLGNPWPDFSDEKLMDTLETWLAPHLDQVTSLSALDRLALGQFVLQSLDWSLQSQVDTLAPVRIAVPSGSTPMIDYRGDEPVLAVKLQEMFGQTETPTIAGGRVPLLIHLLSPARRPVQVTRDLASFWRTTYFDVRKDLKGRYPKHPWPDDPMVAEATARTNRRSR